MIAAGAGCLRLRIFCCLPSLVDPQISSWSQPHWRLPNFLPTERKTSGIKLSHAEYSWYSALISCLQAFATPAGDGKNDLGPCPIWSGTIELHRMYSRDESMVVTGLCDHHIGGQNPKTFICHLCHEAEDDPENAITRAEDPRENSQCLPCHGHTKQKMTGCMTCLLEPQYWRILELQEDEPSSRRNSSS